MGRRAETLEIWRFPWCFSPPLGRIKSGQGDAGGDSIRSDTALRAHSDGLAAAFSFADTGCGTQGRSPRLSLAPEIAMPFGLSHSATAPRRQVSIRSTTGIVLRQAKPAGTWL